MLKGHVFKEQIFGNQIFALFIDTFLNKTCGIASNYKNAMAITFSGNTLNIDSGCCCIRGRFLEEATNTQITAGTDTAFCKLVIEINLDNVNTDVNFTQASYKIVKATTDYPALTQTDIVKNNAGTYQFELAKFKTGASGITDFADTRTYLDFNSIYSKITADYNVVLQKLEQELAGVENGSAYILNSNFKHAWISSITHGIGGVYSATVDFDTNREYMILNAEIKTTNGWINANNSYMYTNNGSSVELLTNTACSGFRIHVVDVTAAG